MAKTRQPIIHERDGYQPPGCAYVLIRCPMCKRTLPLGLEPHYDDGHAIDAEGTVHPDVVCLHRDGAEYCEFAGTVRIANVIEDAATNEWYG